MELLDGKSVSRHIYQKLQNEVEQLKRENIIPKLVIILVGDNPASLSYIKSKLKRSDEIGIETELMKFSPDEMTTEKLISLIHDLNHDQSVNGILVQLPLPKHIY
ncbi:bifunctional methylenetetrahydrofolate dehydrogenase/methenyltetrahydrofolate cyclohydrolase, partial [Candidatus Peregrinibacteria bacterium]|nr:bifunctional methylenetetrahydrofolate dehydrogenase/methenyltetrahydrofolate cyclohydrolase [Candidatus Peregrinibacteria bacterium]